ncbi:hypothetical protein SAMN02745671_00960 [Anaerovibrio lipolyticus DSM 3074]|uniref:Uncharacterized protein n=2 Tax=Selenomonadaceae TaxID=1843491 RepID=A0A1M6C268_9FIRM|nr:hypothetical protein SAMN02745671_00960 [Anaerovibrio lipolyticus DSM 3074]
MGAENMQIKKPMVWEEFGNAELYAHLKQAVDDVKSGRVQDVDEAFDDILSELDRVKI